MSNENQNQNQISAGLSMDITMENSIPTGPNAVQLGSTSVPETTALETTASGFTSANIPAQSAIGDDDPALAEKTQSSRDDDNNNDEDDETLIPDPDPDPDLDVPQARPAPPPPPSRIAQVTAALDPPPKSTSTNKSTEAAPASAHHHNSLERTPSHQRTPCKTLSGSPPKRLSRSSGATSQSLRRSKSGRERAARIAAGWALRVIVDNEMSEALTMAGIESDDE
ncbi:hypothetical protein LZ554_006824 [Drepanopeziza brunnea f. sp. 'monogermtubi']|nr:hypothetical protein LZ554_006824 [Drepanopeziza brunnea f. sp. 'monogermtubi']